MLKFMKHQHKLTPERIQKQKELYGFSKGCVHGFPSKASALAWDQQLRLLAVATKSGDVRVYGTPGVELYGQHDTTEAAVIMIVFLPGQGRLVTLCEDNSLHMWKIQLDGKEGEPGPCLVRVNSTSLEGKLKKISIIVVDSSCDDLMVGTEGGNIYLLNLSTFVMSENIIYQDVVMQNVPEDYKVNPGPVESIAQHPTEPNKILIGYQRGLIVLWDKKNLAADQTYISTQQLESISWYTDSSKFITSHNDGSYVVWSSTDSEKSQDGPNTVYGPFPCKPINKILWPDGKDGEFMVFSGGMPRASHGERHTMTAIQGDNHITFDLSSRIVDFIVTEEKDNGGAECLVILAEEEIVFIDLITESWPSFHNPYMASLHSSAITCAHFVSNCAMDVYDKIQESGVNQHTDMSKRPWPINGGSLKDVTTSKQKDILLTGHEDGTVRFWDASGVALSLLYKLTTAPMFVTDDFGGDGGAAEDDDWPPFRKTGLFDPYSDDPRLGIKKLEMCPFSGTLVVAGTAGQILIMHLVTEEKETKIQCVDVNLVADNDSFVWKSHKKLDLQSEPVTFQPGMHPSLVMQFYPPASCTSLHLHSEWGLVACGTAHGFALLDLIQKKNLLSKSTLSASDMANAADEGPMSRRKSLKKSLRESFRRIRRGRSQRKTGRAKITSPTSPTSPTPIKSGGGVGDEEGVRPVERAIEARTHAPDYVGSMVRCLHLTKCFIANNQMMSATLWAGTNSGAIFVFTIAIPPSDKRADTPPTVQLGKEIHLKHGAPVISISVLDGVGKPFPEPLAVKKEAAPPPDTTSQHKVLICSEEQFKVFTLPQLKPFCKYKLTAHDGARVRKIGQSVFVSSVDECYKEHSFQVVTNQGDISVFSLPDCRRQIQAACFKKEDISGINSAVFSKSGEALYQMSSSEFARISLSVRHVTRPAGTISVVVAEKAATIEPITNKDTDATITEENGPDVTTATDVEAADAADAENAANANAANSEPTKEPQPKQVEDDKKESKVTVVAAVTATNSGNCEAGSVGGGGGSIIKTIEEIKENGDTSVLSGDITIDSIRDHMEDVKVSCDKVKEVVNASSSSTSTSTVVSATDTSNASVVNNNQSDTNSSTVSVVKTTTVTSVSSQESSSVQVVETALAEMNHSSVNGTE